LSALRWIGAVLPSEHDALESRPGQAGRYRYFRLIDGWRP
jgi:hypothetical protein